MILRNSIANALDQFGTLGQGHSLPEGYGNILTDQVVERSATIAFVEDSHQIVSTKPKEIKVAPRPPLSRCGCTDAHAE